MKRYLVKGEITAYVEAPNAEKAEEFLAEALEELSDDPSGFVTDWEAIDTETVKELEEE